MPAGLTHIKGKPCPGCGGTYRGAPELPSGADHYKHHLEPFYGPEGVGLFGRHDDQFAIENLHQGVERVGMFA